MKHNKWILTAACSCAAFIAGLAAGLSLARRKGKEPVGRLPAADGLAAADAIEEEECDE